MNTTPLALLLLLSGCVGEEERFELDVSGAVDAQLDGRAWADETSERFHLHLENPDLLIDLEIDERPGVGEHEVGDADPEVFTHAQPGLLVVDDDTYQWGSGEGTVTLAASSSEAIEGTFDITVALSQRMDDSEYESVGDARLSASFHAPLE